MIERVELGHLVLISNPYFALGELTRNETACSKPAHIFERLNLQVSIYQVKRAKQREHCLIWQGAKVRFVDVPFGVRIDFSLR